MKKLIVLGMSSMMALGASAQTLEERVEALEYAGYESIFRFKGQVEMMYSTKKSDYTKEIGVTGAEDTTKSGTHEIVQELALFSNIDMSAKPSEKLSFFGRLSMAKLSNRMNAYSFGTFGDLDGQIDEGQGKRNAEVWMERAFINYSFTKNLIFTFGRLPSANGSPYNLTRDESSGGAYPLFMFNAHFDGMALSYAVNNFSFKFIYTPFSFENNSSTTRTDGKDFETPSDTFSFITEYNNEKVSWARRFNVQLGYISAKVPLALTEYDMKNTATSSDDTALGLSELEIALSRAVLTLEANGIANSKFDFNLQHMVVTYNSNGDYTNTNVFTGFGGITTSGSFLSDDGKEQSGTATIITTRYAIKNNMKVGFQYSQGSQDVYVSDLVGKLPIATVVPGTAYHLFYNHGFDGGLKMNVGWISSQTDYSTGTNLFQRRKDADIKEDAGYLSFVANF
jgi:hypothetical protein